MGWTANPNDARKRDHGPAKVCDRCGVAKAPDDFHRSSQRPSGHYPVCKACRTLERTAEWHADVEKSRAERRERHWRERDLVLPRLRENYQANKVTMNEASRSGHLRRKYGLTPDEYDALAATQDNRCAVCGRHETDRDHRSGEVRRLAVDHCHDTGAVRGLLCRKCNTAVGLLGESLDNVRSLLTYLEVADGAQPEIGGGD